MYLKLKAVLKCKVIIVTISYKFLALFFADYLNSCCSYIFSQYSLKYFVLKIYMLQILFTVKNLLQLAYVYQYLILA